MATTTGLFRRNGHFYVRLLLSLHHPLRLTGKSRVVKSLGTSSLSEAKVRALETRLKILLNLDTSVHCQLDAAQSTPRLKFTNLSEMGRSYFQEVEDCLEMALLSQ